MNSAAELNRSQKLAYTVASHVPDSEEFESFVTYDKARDIAENRNVYFRQAKMISHKK